MINLGTALFDSAIDLKGIRRGISDIQAMMARKENAVSIQLYIDPASLKAVQSQILGALTGGGGGGGIGAQFGAAIATGLQAGVSKALADVGKEVVKQEGTLAKERLKQEAKTSQDILKIRADEAALTAKINAQAAADQRKAELLRQQTAAAENLSRLNALQKREADEKKFAEARNARALQNERQDQLRETAAQARRVAAIEAMAAKEAKLAEAALKKRHADHAKLIAAEAVAMQRDADRKAAADKREFEREAANARKLQAQRDKDAATALAAAQKNAAAMAEAQNKAIRALGSLAGNVGQNGTAATFKLLGTESGKAFVEGIGSYKGAVGEVFNKLGTAGSSALISSFATVIPGFRTVLGTLGTSGGQTLLQSFTQQLSSGTLLSNIKTTFSGLFSGVGTSGGGSILTGLKGALTGGALGGLATTIGTSLIGGMLKAGTSAAVNFMKTFSEGVINLSKQLFSKVAEMSGAAVKGTLNQIDKSVDVAGSIDTDSKTAAVVSNEQRKAIYSGTAIGSNKGGIGIDGNKQTTNERKAFSTVLTDSEVQAQFRQQALALGADPSLVVTPGQVAEAQKALAMGGQTSSFISASLKDIISMSNSLKQDLKSTVNDVLDITAATDFTKGRNGETLSQQESDILASRAVKQIFGSVVSGRVKLADLAQSTKYSRFGDGTAQSLEDTLTLTSLGTQAGLRGSTAGTNASAFFENLDKLRATKSFENVKLDNADGTQKTQTQLLQAVVASYNEIKTNAGKRSQELGMTEGEYLRRVEADTMKALDKRGYNYLTKVATLDLEKNDESKALKLAGSFVRGLGGDGLIDKLQDIPTNSVGSGKRLLSGSIESVQGSIGFALDKPVDTFFKGLGSGIDTIFGGIKTSLEKTTKEKEYNNNNAAIEVYQKSLDSLLQKRLELGDEKPTDSKEILAERQRLDLKISSEQTQIENIKQINIQNAKALFRAGSDLVTQEVIQKDREYLQKKLEDARSRELQQLQIKLNFDAETIKNDEALNDEQKEEQLQKLQKSASLSAEAINENYNNRVADLQAQQDLLTSNVKNDRNTFAAWDELLKKDGTIDKLTEFLSKAGPEIAKGLQAAFNEGLKLFSDKSFISDLKDVFEVGKTIFNIGSFAFQAGFKLIAQVGKMLPAITKGLSDTLKLVPTEGLIGGAERAVRQNTGSQTAEATGNTSQGVLATLVQGFMGGLGGGAGQIITDNGANLALLGTQLLQTVVSIASFVGQIVGFLLRAGSVILGVVLPPLNTLLGIFNAVLSVAEGITRQIFAVGGGLLEFVGAGVFKVMDVTLGSTNKSITSTVAGINKIASISAATITDSFSRATNFVAKMSDDFNSKIGPSVLTWLKTVGENASKIDLGRGWNSFIDNFKWVKGEFDKWIGGAIGAIGGGPAIAAELDGTVSSVNDGASVTGAGLGDRIAESMRSGLSKVPVFILELITKPFGISFAEIATSWAAKIVEMSAQNLKWSDEFRGMLGWIGNQSMTFVGNAWNGVSTGMKAADRVWSDTLRGFMGWIGNQSIPFVKGAWDVATTGMNAASKAFSDVFRGIIAWFGNVSLPWVKGVWDGITKFMSSSMKTTGDFIKNIFNDMGNTLKAKFEGPIAWISEKLQGVVKAAGDALGLLNGGGATGTSSGDYAQIFGGSGESTSNDVGGGFIANGGGKLGAQAGANAQKVAEIMRGAGIPEPVIAAALVNAVAESGLNANAIGDGGHSVGLFQLNDFGAGAGMSVEERKDVLTNTKAILRDGGVSKVLAAYNQGTKDIGELAALWSKHVERPADESGEMEARRKLAKKYFPAGNIITNTASALLGGATGKMANTTGYTVWSTGGGSYEHGQGDDLRAHHNMNGAYDTSTPGITKNKFGQGVYDMTLETETGDIQIPVPAPVSGKVVHAGLMGGYGNTVTIKSGNEEILIAHLERIFVKEGQTVNEGTEIGIQGGTGAGGADVYPIHVHLESSAAVAKRYADRIASGYYKGKVSGGGGNKDMLNFGVVKPNTSSLEPAPNTQVYGNTVPISPSNVTLTDAVTSGGATDSVFTPKIHRHVTAIVSGGGGNKDAVIGGGFGSGDQANCTYCAIVSGGGGTSAPVAVVNPTNTIVSIKVNDISPKATNVPTLPNAPKTPDYKSVADIVNAFYKNRNGSYDTKGISFGFVDANGNLPSNLGFIDNAKSLSEALKGYSNEIPIDSFAAEKKARDAAIKEIEDKISGNRKEDLLGDAKDKITKLEKTLADAIAARGVVQTSIGLSQKEFANKQAQKRQSIDAQLDKDNKDLAALYDRYGGKDNAVASSAKFGEIKDKLMANLAGANTEAAKESILKGGIESLKGSKDEISFRRLLLLEAAQREYAEVNKRERGLDKEVKLAAVRDKQIARFGTYLTGLDRSIAEKEFAISQLQQSRTNLDTNSDIDSQQLDIATKNKKIAADKAVADAEAAIKSAKKDLADLVEKQRLQKELEKLQNEKLEKEQNISDVRFKQIDAYLRSRGYNPTYDDVLKIYLRSKQIEQNEGVLPSKLDENVRKALFEAGLFGAGAQYLNNNGKSVEFPTSSVYDLMNSSGIYSGMGGTQYGSIGINSTSRTNAVLDITGGAVIGVDNTVPRNTTRSTGGGGNKTIRFQFEGIDEEQLVSARQIKSLQNYINDPAFMDDVMDVMVDRLTYDSALRAKVGLR